MPPRPPPPPGTLTLLCCLAAAAGTWLAIALEQAVRALAGRIAGMPFSGFAIAPDHGWTVVAVQDVSAAGSVAFAFVVIAGSLAVLLVTSVVYWVASNMRSGVVRGFALVWSTVGLLWIPSVIAMAVLPAGVGPGSLLYARLGEPQPGRWSAAALGLLILVVTAGVASSRAVSTGRAWMRADALEFRKRLVRVVAGWPGIVAVAALALGAGWARTPLVLVWIMAVMLVFQLRTK